MLNKTKAALLGAMAVAAFASTNVQAATQTADARVVILPAVQLAQNQQLDFGVVASSSVAGTVVMPTASSTRSCTGGVTCVGTAFRGQFTITGAENGYVVGISVPASTTLAFGTITMPVTLTSSLTTFTSTGAAQQFFVGGTLTVGANQAAGTYTGTYNVSANYQ